MPHATLTSPSPAAASSRSPRRSNPHVHRPAMRDVPTHAPPLPSPCPSSFIMTSGDPFEWHKIRRIYHAWSQAVDACTGPPTSAPPPPPLYGAAHHQEREPTGQYLPPPEAQGGFFLRSSLPLPLSPLPSLPPAFVPQVPVCVNANDAFAAQVASPEERARIVDAICPCDGEMMMHHNWAVQCCLEATTGPEERPQRPHRRPRAELLRVPRPPEGSRLQGEEVCLLTGLELLRVDPATTLVNKHASDVSNKITELSWTPPAPPIFTYYVAPPLLIDARCAERAKDGIVDELLTWRRGIKRGREEPAGLLLHPAQYVGEAPASDPRAPPHCLLESATNEQGSQSALTALKEGGKEALDCVVQRMCEPANGVRRAMIVDLALSLTGSQLIASVLPMADKDQRASLYDCIRGHVARLQDRLDGYLAFVLNLYSLISLHFHDRLKLRTPDLIR
ncbi:hypothetical protein B0H14DRAFT_3175309 [Mycena olivaceomarginata]|nr:hypothetical protein B0H14DRAFT_3175309 [Mycena olivaceomarginata]